MKELGTLPLIDSDTAWQASSLRIHEMQDGSATIIHEESGALLLNPSAYAVLLLCDGSRTLREVAQALFEGQHDVSQKDGSATDSPVDFASILGQVTEIVSQLHLAKCLNQAKCLSRVPSPESK